MRRVSIEITGVAPLLFNGWTGAIGDKAPTNEAEEIAQGWRRVYKNEAGLYWPVDNLKKCWYEGAKKARQIFNLKRKGGAGIADFIRSGVFIDPMQVPFLLQGEVNLHEQMGRIPPGPKGHAVLIRRPQLREWTLAFEAIVLDPVMTDDEMRISLEAGGMFVGMGGHRPEFGRFEVTKFAA
ncbi:MAG: hypothetical protein HW375_3 [Anaerolineales bacterium]|nr:hypothetical protein [Anaerolineales bacterium]